ncbi:hypothetical protein M9H77_11908 [Catharanthus roseus]|uniref:Uncharacterized protein n=1 Tax=Catharanthus roseus TaxID=4058 RepID=A0ACC0BG03_CATRO|nr:hypothetical protein M9H77_11908 [Catharanthus roseus]
MAEGHLALQGYPLQVLKWYDKPLIQATESENVSNSAKDNVMLGQVSATGSLSAVSIPGPVEQLYTTTESEKGKTGAQANSHPVLDHGLIKDTIAYKGYYSDSNVVAGFVQDKENEFESLRGFHNLLKAKTNPKPSGILNFGKTTSKATNGNVKCRKSTRSRK